MKTRSAALVLLTGFLAFPAVLPAQDKPKKIVLDDFESDLSDWAPFKADSSGFGQDEDSKVAITHEAAEVKAGKGSLTYSYEVTPDTIRMLGLPRPLDLTGMKSLHLWLKCSHATAVVIALTESGGGSYQTSVNCNAEKWQEVAVNLDEFVLDDPSKDSNGMLDLDQIGSIQVIDAGGFLAKFLPELKGARKIWLDDFEFSSQEAPRTQGLTQVTKVVPAFLVDNFESSVIRWIPVSLAFGETPQFAFFDLPLVLDRDVPPGGGKQSLKVAYPRQGKKIHAILRNVEKVDLSKATELDLCLKTSRDGTFIVSLEEKNGARYQKKLELKAADGWKAFGIAFREFTLAEDSKDDNDRLDADKLKQISVADITNLIGGGEADENRLWVDEVRFVLSP
ncbi:MAG TPA: hypothetical protein VKU80_07835 [Planctomycetota bacterium]|nr:hypothetical protein [Planctomycetota bacterium]